MAYDLSKLNRATASKPPRLLVHGDPGVGKTSLASEFPDHVFIQVEEGTPGDAEIMTLGTPSTLAETMDMMFALYTQPHSFKWLVIDSLTSLQKLVWAETCEIGDEKGHKKERIEDFGYGKGYSNAVNVWQKVLDGAKLLRDDRGMGIVYIAHSVVSRFDDPETVSYHRYEIDLHDKAVGAFEREVDAILLLKRPVHIKTEDVGFNKKRAIGDGASNLIEICAQPKPAYVAKNRYGMPATMEFKRGSGYETLAQYFPASPATKE